MRVIHDLRQGSDAWHQFRLDHHGASECAAMLGLSTLIRRTELLHAKHTGNAREFSDWVQKHVLDYGHQVEASARKHVEEYIGDDLYAVTCSLSKLSASCDGLTLDDGIAWEHKQHNAGLAASLRDGIVPEQHMPQCQQVLMVTGAKKLIFTVSDGTPDRMLHVDVFPDQAWFERIVDGWAQFEKDLAAYVPVEIVEKPAGKRRDTLPALRIEISGEVSSSNLDQFEQTALAAIRSVNRELTTDEHFADAAEDVKWCSDVESRLDAAKEHALSQTASIDQLFKTIDDISAEARAVRLELDKLVTKRKGEIKDGLTLKARQAYSEYIAQIKTETEGIWYVPVMQPDFAAAAKNKRTLASLQDSVDTELANAKISADAMAKSIRANLATLKSEAVGFEFLFADKSTLMQKAPEDLKLAISARIDAHRVAEAAKTKAAADAAAKTAADIAAINAMPSPTQVAAVRFIPIQPSSIKRPADDTRPAINLGEIGRRLGFDLKRTFIEDELHITASHTVKAAVFWQEADFPRICAALVAHVQHAAQPVEA